jgi:hypothetical protein
MYAPPPPQTSSNYLATNSAGFHHENHPFATRPSCLESAMKLCHQRQDNAVNKPRRGGLLIFLEQLDFM